MIRKATEGDLPAILEIYNDAILNTTAVYDYKAHTIEERRAWYKSKIEEGWPLLVYEDNLKVIGFASFGPFRAWPAYKYTIEDSIYVSRDCRKMGIGTQLLKELIRIANERGYATIVAGIDSSNTASIRMHENQGFELSGVIKRAGYKFGRWLDLAFYQLILDGPKAPVE